MKYEMIPEGDMFRIKALRDGPWGPVGTLGGLIEKEYNLNQNGDCWVYEAALVSGDALVSGNARAYGNALVSGNALVHGNALVYGNARVSGYARVYGNAQVYGDAQVSGNAQVYEDAQVHGDALVFGVSKVQYKMAVHGKAHLASPITSVNRTDGFTFIKCKCEDGVERILAGCRYFTMEEARSHWELTRKGTPLGDETMKILDFLETL